MQERGGSFIYCLGTEGWNKISYYFIGHCINNFNTTRNE